MNLAFAGMVPLFVFLWLRWFPGPLGLAEMCSAVFWLLMSLIVAAAALPLLAVNLWFCRRGFTAVLPQPIAAAKPVGPEPALVPTPANALCVFVLSLVLLAASIGLTVLQLAGRAY